MPKTQKALKRARSAPKGRRVGPEAREDILALLGDSPRRRDLLIEYLHKIQDRFGCLSASHLVALAAEMKMAMAEVYEVATFYHHFDVVKDGSPPPAITVRVCDSIACEMAGSHELLATLPGLLGPEVRVIHAPCVGRCETAPVAVVGQNPVPYANAVAVAALVRANAVKHPRRDSPISHPHLDVVTPGHIEYAAYREQGGYELARACVASEKTREDIVAAMEDSGLRGLGGAGFPAGRKWKSVAAGPAPRLMAINIDEGEPGTFKDRYYLERDPHRFLEGALIAAWAVDIAEVYIYLRDEYHGCREILEKEIAALHANPPCPIPPIHLRRGAGAYICGEESAMIESIEGKRGEPRLRPPYVAQVGLFGRPTLEHNMETLHWVRDILENGPGWFAGHGRHGRKGLRSFSVSGRVKKPGVHLAPAGITVEGVDRRVLRRDARGPRVLRLPAGGRVRRHPAGVDGRHPARFRHPERVRLLHRIRGDRGPLGPRHRNEHRAQSDEVFRRGVLRPVHPLPRRHGQGARPSWSGRAGTSRS